ncbi:hypothetical protein [Carboxylicivirga marina]|uniref:Uncharacterized protein n=1 Tax=Carboxylicivirga marina TaxID=2800988 RepID=A0ABS1HHS1_9BACT|nr:hypothetical protein [Carboxylicivirga marina]MBK3517166.1 hypothetical protein [Carboxylicivirga marina]
MIKKPNLDTIVFTLWIAYMFIGFIKLSAISSILVLTGAILGCALLFNRTRGILKGEIKFQLCFYFLVAPVISIWFIYSAATILIEHFSTGTPLFL